MEKDALQMCERVYPVEEVTLANKRHRQESQWLQEYQKMKEDAHFEEYFEGGDSELEEDHTPLVFLERDEAKAEWTSGFSYGMTLFVSHVSLYLKHAPSLLLCVHWPFREIFRIPGF